ncbi:DMT family transporter [Nocardia asteroides]|uniref:DMT family transporter n=1 Tax=Nocardia asteroides TaxID=1824 RepID=UPI001E49138C|nr:DMT family transporter [Nocardia asteroides]UGT60025.1 DMT family transporter [Nocardia asteroides]
MSRAALGVWLTVASGLAFAASGPLVKAVLGAGWSAGAVLAVRLTGAAAVMLLLAVFADPRGLWAGRRELRTVVPFGAIGVAGVQASFFLSLATLQVAVTLMIQFLAPVVVIAWHWVVGRRRPSTGTLAGAAVTLAGAALVVQVFGAGSPDPAGLAWAGLSMIGNAVFFLLSERSTARLSPVALLGSGLTVAALTTWLLAGIGALPLVVGAGTALMDHRELPVPLALTLLVLVSTVLAYLCGVAGAARLGATLMSLVLLSEVLFAVGLSWLLLGEAVTPVQLVGSVLVVAGLAVANRAAEPVVAVPLGGIEPDEEGR